MLITQILYYIAVFFFTANFSPKYNGYVLMEKLNSTNNYTDNLNIRINDLKILSEKYCQFDIVE